MPHAVLLYNFKSFISGVKQVQGSRLVSHIETVTMPAHGHGESMAGGQNLLEPLPNSPVIHHQVLVFQQGDHLPVIQVLLQIPLISHQPHQVQSTAPTGRASISSAMIKNASIESFNFLVFSSFLLRIVAIEKILVTVLWRISP